ncbi:NUDIX hydrolase [Nocardia sp. NPDC003726]
MGRRIDYHHDPNAPAANSVRPSAGAFVRRGETVLLICRSDNGNWSMPGGTHDPGESLSHTAIRKTREETGVQVRLTGLVGVFTDPTTTSSTTPATKNQVGPRPRSARRARRSSTLTGRTRPTRDRGRSRRERYGR